MEQKKIGHLPQSPGVYIFKKGSKILYIGRATSLRDRVRSYFGDDLLNTRGPLLVDMVTLATKISHIETDSVLEAIILEANLIKKYQPKYNTIEKDNKTFNYVVFTDEPVSKIIVLRERELGSVRARVVFGPFPNGPIIRDGLKILRRIFPFHDDSSSKVDQSVFYRQLGLAPDLSREEVRREYEKNIDNLILFFNGKKKQLVRGLESDMKRFAKARDFEKAVIARNKIKALSHIQDISLIKNEDLLRKDKTFRIEAYDISHISGTNMVGVMTVITNGVTDKNEYRKFRIRGYDSSNDVGALTEVMKRRLGHPEWVYPNLVVVDGSTAQKRAIETLFNQLGVQIPVMAVVKNEKHKPKAILGNKDLAHEHEKSIILANAESHRFAVAYHRNRRSVTRGLPRAINNEF